MESDSTRGTDAEPTNAPTPTRPSPGLAVPGLARTRRPCAGRGAGAPRPGGELRQDRLRPQPLDLGRHGVRRLALRREPLQRGRFGVRVRAHRRCLAAGRSHPPQPERDLGHLRHVRGRRGPRGDHDLQEGAQPRSAVLPRAQARRLEEGAEPPDRSDRQRRVGLLGRDRRRRGDDRLAEGRPRMLRQPRLHGGRRVGLRARAGRLDGTNEVVRERRGTAAGVRNGGRPRRGSRRGRVTHGAGESELDRRALRVRQPARHGLGRDGQAAPERGRDRRLVRPERRGSRGTSSSPARRTSTRGAVRRSCSSS